MKNKCSSNAQDNAIADCAKRDILLDNNRRTINYLRLSVTDRCNLRCIYCMPEEGIEFQPHSEILTYEEMLRVVRLCVRNGIWKVRLTGGEPLVRADGYLRGCLFSDRETDLKTPLRQGKEDGIGG